MAESLIRLIETKIQASLKNLGDLFPEVSVHSEDNVHFDAIVKSSIFQGMPRVKRQQLVYACVSEEIRSGLIHALSLKTEVD